MEEETNKRRWFCLVGNTGLLLRTRQYIPEDFELQLLKILLSHKGRGSAVEWVCSGCRYTGASLL
jgi:hypothetical protein